MSYYSAATQWAIKQSLAKSRAERADTTSKVYTDVKCYRCKNTLYEGDWFYFRPKDQSRWFVFCREDCARLHVGKDAKLYSKEEYANIILHKAIKEK